MSTHVEIYGYTHQVSASSTCAIAVTCRRGQDRFANIPANTHVIQSYNISMALVFAGMFASLYTYIHIFDRMA